jgi:hypothetical protein
MEAVCLKTLQDGKLFVGPVRNRPSCSIRFGMAQNAVLQGRKASEIGFNQSIHQKIRH